MEVCWWPCQRSGSAFCFFRCWSCFRGLKKSQNWSSLDIFGFKKLLWEVGRNSGNPRKNLSEEIKGAKKAWKIALTICGTPRTLQSRRYHSMFQIKVSFEKRFAKKMHSERFTPIHSSNKLTIFFAEDAWNVNSNYLIHWWVSCFLSFDKNSV